MLGARLLQAAARVAVVPWPRASRLSSRALSLAADAPQAEAPRRGRSRVLRLRSVVLPPRDVHGAVEASEIVAAPYAVIADAPLPSPTRAHVDVATPASPRMRLARWLTRAGAAPSRRTAEAAIAAGRVAVNGAPALSPAVNVGDGDVIAVDGARVAAPPAGRQPLLFLVHKLAGELVSRVDPQGRATLFDRLAAMGVPAGLMAVGRLDYLTEGLLLLTNDGDVARFLSHPASHVPRTYRVRVYGVADRVAAAVAAFRRGPIVDGVRFRPARASVMQHEEVARRFGVAPPDGGGRGDGGAAAAAVADGGDRDGVAGAPPTHGAAASSAATHPPAAGAAAAAAAATASPGHRRVNAWLEVALTEGKNREIRRVAEAHGLTVTRLVRVGYGGYTLSGLGRGDVLQVSRVPHWIVARRPRRPLDVGNSGRGDEEASPSSSRPPVADAEPPLRPPIGSSLPASAREATARPAARGNRGASFPGVTAPRSPTAGGSRGASRGASFAGSHGAARGQRGPPKPAFHWEAAVPPTRKDAAT